MPRISERSAVTEFTANDFLMGYDADAPERARMKPFPFSVMSAFVQLVGDARYATTGHDHSGVYSPVGHDHSGVYAPASHDHDSRYYTESEIDAMAFAISRITGLQAALDAKLPLAGGTLTGELTISKASALIRLHNTAGGANVKQASFYSEAGNIGFAAYNDAGVWQRTLGYWDHATGNYYTGFSQEIGGTITCTGGHIEAKGGWPGFGFWDTDAAVGKKRAYLKYDSGELVFMRLSDAGAIVDYPFAVTADGVVAPGYGIKLANYYTGGRIASPPNGYIGFNLDTNQVEVYRNGWHTVETNLGTGLKWNEVSDGTAFVDIVFPSGAKGLRIRGYYAPNTSGQFLCAQTSHDGGSSFTTAAASYKWGYWQRTGGSDGSGADANNTFLRVGANQTGLDLCPFEIVFVTTDGNGYSTMFSRSMGFDGTNTNSIEIAGFRNSTTAINAVRLLPASGSIHGMRYVWEAF